MVLTAPKSQPLHIYWSGQPRVFLHLMSLLLWTWWWFHVSQMYHICWGNGLSGTKPWPVAVLLLCGHKKKSFTEIWMKIPFFHESAFEYVVCRMPAILLRPQSQITELVVNYGISNIIVLEITMFTTNSAKWHVRKDLLIVLVGRINSIDLMHTKFIQIRIFYTSISM